MSKDSTNAGYGLVMFLLGAAVGAGVALLYAPQPGGDTRRVLGEKANEYRDKATEMTSTVAQTAKEKINQATDKVSELLHRGQQEAADTLDNAADTMRQPADTVS
ncbi:MAG TPA: YtxH domain-containing protein [Chthonomonadaceae bacterium]|nr:YtxH domain-containing protein [Chthonomonadaceae bacterium]